MKQEGIYNGIVGTTILRGFLAFIVALHHADIFKIGYFPLMSGRSAVIGFFVLSGWVMTWFFYSNDIPMTIKRTGNFYFRRLLRLGPVLIINFILVCCVMKKVMPWELIGLLPVWPTPLPKFFNHILWTLVVEIEFYVLLPLLLMAKNYWRKSLGIHVTVYSLLFIIPRVIAFTLEGLNLESTLDMRSLAGNACYFYAGIAFCVASLQGRSWLKEWNLSGLVMCILGCWGFAAITYAYWNIVYNLIGVHGIVVGALAVIECARRFMPREYHSIPALLKPLYGLGVISYGYYVFHGFCLGLIELHKISWGGQIVELYSGLGFVMLVIAPLAMACAMYFTLEKWINRFSHHLVKMKS